MDATTVCDFVYIDKIFYHYIKIEININKLKYNYKMQVIPIGSGIIKQTFILTNSKNEYNFFKDEGGKKNYMGINLKNTRFKNLEIKVQALLDNKAFSDKVISYYITDNIKNSDMNL